jgi:hypothetical protein
MIGIKLGEKWLKLPEDAKFELIIKTPLFVYDAQPASRISPFIIDANGNQDVLECGNLIDKRNKVYTYDCYVYIDNTPYKKGKLDINKTSRDKYECQVRLDKSYYGDLAGKSLRSFNYKKDNTGWRFWYKNCEHTLFTFDPVVVAHPVYTFNIRVVYAGVNYDHAIEYKDGVDNNLDVYPDARINFLDRIVYAINDNHDIHKHFAQRIGYDKLVIGNAGGEINPIFVHSGSSLDITYLAEGYLYNSGTFHPYEFTDNVIDEVQQNPTLFDHCFFPIINKNYYGKELSEMNKSVFFYVPETIKYMNAKFPVHYDLSIPGTHVNSYLHSITPFVYLYDLIKYLNEEIGADIEDSFFDEELKKLCLYSSIDASESFKKTAGAQWMFTARKFKFSEALPDKTLAEFYNGIGTQFCTVFAYDSTRAKLKIVPRKKILSNPNYTDWTSKEVYGSVSDSKTFKPDIKYAFDSNDIAPSDRIKPLLKINAKASVSSILGLLSVAKANNFIDDYRLVESGNLFYGVLKQFGVGSAADLWSFLSENLYNYKFDDDATRTDFIETTSTTLCQELDILGKSANNDATDNFYHLLLPIIDQVGRSTREKAIQDEHGLRLLFYRGLKPIWIGYGQPGNIGVESEHVYGWGTYDNKFIDGTTDGNYSLNMNGDSGIINTWWKDWLKFIATNPPEEKILTLSKNDLFTFDELEKKRFGNQEYLIDEIRVLIGKGIELSKMICYPNKSGHE